MGITPCQPTWQAQAINVKLDLVLDAPIMGRLFVKGSAYHRPLNRLNYRPNREVFQQERLLDMTVQRVQQVEDSSLLNTSYGFNRVPHKEGPKLRSPKLFIIQLLSLVQKQSCSLLDMALTKPLPRKAFPKSQSSLTPFMWLRRSSIPHLILFKFMQQPYSRNYTISFPETQTT